MCVCTCKSDPISSPNRNIVRTRRPARPLSGSCSVATVGTPSNAKQRIGASECATYSDAPHRRCARDSVHAVCATAHGGRTLKRAFSTSCRRPPYWFATHAPCRSCCPTRRPNPECHDRSAVDQHNSAAFNSAKERRRNASPRHATAIGYSTSLGGSSRPSFSSFRRSCSKSRIAIRIIPFAQFDFKLAQHALRMQPEVPRRPHVCSRV